MTDIDQRTVVHFNKRLSAVMKMEVTIKFYSISNFLKEKYG